MRTTAVLALSALYLILASALSASATEISIFDVRKTLPMSNDEKPIRDFYLNRGSEEGLKEGMVITARRRVPLYDSYQNRSVGDLRVDVAKVIVIHVQKGLAVARFYEDVSRDGLPLLEDPFLMVGDSLDLSTATIPSRAPKKNALLDIDPAPAPKPQPSEPKPDVSSIHPVPPAENRVDFASKAPDNSPNEAAVQSLQ